MGAIYTVGVIGPSYDEIAAAVAPTGMVARGGFVVGPDDDMPDTGSATPTPSVVVVGNIGGAMWPRFAAGRRVESHPLDAWTRRMLRPIAERFGATYVHPSDEPFPPIQRWARRADAVWPSPIGLLIHPEHGLWHAYRGAFCFDVEVTDLPARPDVASPCITCADQPCLSTCPVDAFSVDGYDHVACRGHLERGDEPDCLHDGCAARRACPVNATGYYGPDQMLFHMRAFAGFGER